jgi:DNA-binding LacI/PurR family transcriptional regulator
VTGVARTHPTILDVAERAGVSKSLVSLVMRGATQVSEEKRAAVLQAAKELKYRPNEVARSLVRKRGNLIGVLLSDLHNPFFTEVVDGVEEAAIGAGYRALFNTGSRLPERESVALETLLHLRTDGVILAAPVLPGREVAAAAAVVPVVLVARNSRSRSVDSVTNDDRAGARMAVDHLVELGHRAIAHIDGGGGSGAEARRAGYVEAMRRHRLSRHVRVAPGAFTEEGGMTGVDSLLGAGPPPTAIFAANDLAAVGALHALERHGLRVPADVSLVGYDNTSLAAMGHVDLTTIHQPRREMGATAVALLLERLEDGRRRSRHLVVQPHLMERGTSAPPGNRSGGRPRASTRKEDRST